MKTQRGERSLAWLTGLNPLVPPILLAAFPVVSLFQHNQSEIDLNVLWRPLALSAASGAALFVLFRLVLKRGARAGLLASLVVVAFFYYGIYLRHVSGWGLGQGARFPVWVTLFVLGVVALLWTKRDLINLNRVLSAVATAVLLVPVGKIAIYRIDHPPVRISDPRLWPTALQKPILMSGERRPDIYYIIPDDYERTDVLKRYFRFDNSKFIRELERRGFVVANEGRSPYSKSEFNMASALNLDYLSRLPKILGKSSQDVLLVRRMIEDSRAAQLLESLGYRYIHLDSDNITFAADNPHISPLAAPDNLTYLWLRDSLLRLVGGRYGFTEAATNERFRRSVRSAFAKLDAVPSEPGPKFVLFHTLMPHDPYIFGARAQSVTFPDRSDTGHSTKQGMRYYVRQLEFLNRKLLETTDAILAHSKAPPIIVIQSDEGFEALPENWGEKAVQDMRVKGLSAFYLPGRPKARLPQQLNSVNSFRFLFNRYFGTHYALLPSASYPELDLPYQFEKMSLK
jgi:hypothetical protein